MTDTKGTSTAPEIDPRLRQAEPGLKGYLANLGRRARGGDLGSLPVVVGLIIIWAYFQLQNSNFLSAQNLSNLMLQIVSTGLISLGIVLVLLLGEIDLSAGIVAGLCGAVLAVLSINHGWNPWLAAGAALVVGCAIGTFQGWVFSRLGVPSFVVTLAGQIGWTGVLLKILGNQGTINLPFGRGIGKLTSTFLTDAGGWVLGVVVVALFVLAQLNGIRTRARAGLRAQPMSEVIIRTVAVAVGVIIVVWIFNKSRGVPLAVVIFVGLVVLVDLMIRRTRYGRRIMAVGGNPEAARRAGISVPNIRLTVFMLASTLAALGGIMLASRAASVTQSSGGGEVLLNAIAAAVIGGTSLFGGRGSAYSALLGMLVIGSISNGLDLVGQSSSTKFMITGAVLLIAVILDSLSRRGRQASGRA